MKLKSLAALTTAAVLFLSGCSREAIPVSTNISASKTNLSFSWWGNDLYNQNMIEGIRCFTDKYPDLKISMQYRDEDSFLDLFHIQKAANTESDVIQLRYDWLYQIDAENTFYPLSKVKQYLNMHLMNADTLEWGKINDTLYALPDGINTSVCCYNQNLLQTYESDIPATWDDLFALAKKTAADGLFVLGMDEAQFWLMANARLEQTAGHPLLDENGKICCTDQELSEWTAFCQSLLSEHVVTLLSEPALALADQSACGILSWTSYAETISSLEEAELECVTIGPLPVCEGNAPVTGWHYKPTVFYAISKDTEHPKEAAQFLSFVLNNNNMIRLLGLSNGYPASHTTYNTLQEEKRLTGFSWDACSYFKDNSDSFTLMNPYLERKELQNAFLSVVRGTETLDFLKKEADAR